MSRQRGVLAALLLATGLVHAAGETPAPAPAPASRSWLGVWLEDAVDGGVQIIEVVPNGPAAKAGLASGDLVIRIGSKDVADRIELSNAL